MLIEMALQNCEWGDLNIEVHCSKHGIKEITVDGKRPQGREVEMINMSLQEIQKEAAWLIYQDAKETEYENRLFMGRIF